MAKASPETSPVRFGSAQTGSAQSRRRDGAARGDEETQAWSTGQSMERSWGGEQGKQEERGRREGKGGGWEDYP